LPVVASRALALLAVLLDSGSGDLKSAAMSLRSRLMLSNEETEELLWVGQQLPRLEKWEDLSKSTMKRLMADGRWRTLETLYRADPANAEEVFAFNERTAALAEEGVSPEPFVTGDMLIRFGASPGPSFKKWLEALYDRQLEGEFKSEDEAVTAAKELIAAR
jgi:hypothetical protein